ERSDTFTVLSTIPLLVAMIRYPYSVVRDPTSTRNNRTIYFVGNDLTSSRNDGVPLFCCHDPTTTSDQASLSCRQRSYF
ncbi:hypothetical protein Csa_006216, partial [Cucumis sativus]